MITIQTDDISAARATLIDIAVHLALETSLRAGGDSVSTHPAEFTFYVSYEELSELKEALLHAFKEEKIEFTLPDAPYEGIRPISLYFTSPAQ